MAIVLGIAGCSTHAAQGPAQELPLLTATTAEATQPPAQPAPVPHDEAGGGATVSPPIPPGKAAVAKSVQRIARTAAVGAVVVDRDTDETIVFEAGDRQFAAGSLVKLLIGVDALIRHPAEDSVRRRVTLMIKFSDDEIASGFWVAEGGVAIVNRMRRTMGLQSTEPPVPSSRWGNTLITANDMVRVYDYILTTATAADRLTIVEAMAAASGTGADGFKQHFGIPSATGLQWAIKQAWATDSANKKAVHSTGLVGKNWRYVVVVLTEHPARQTWDLATRSVTAGAEAAMSTLE